MSKPDFNKNPPEEGVKQALKVFIGTLIALFVLLALRNDPDAAMEAILLPFALSVLSYIFAGGNFYHGHRFARRQATLKAMEQFSSERMLKGRQLIRSLYATAEEDKPRAVQAIAEDEEDATNFLFFLDYMENLAIGLNNHVYDLSMVEERLGKSIHAYYVIAKPLIDISRQNAPGDGPGGRYQNFEALAEHFNPQP